MQLIIPMSGLGKRFVNANYTVPKPLINVDGFSIIQHVVNLFPNVDDITFICNEEHIIETNMYNTLKLIKPNCKIHVIKYTGLGPVDAVMQKEEYIDDNKECIVSYCDFGCEWNYDDFISTIHNADAIGAIPCYTGFHPHMLGTDNYAFVKHNNMVLEEIREKKPFTDNRMNEFASNGIYYFKTGGIMKHYFKKLIEQNIKVNGEFYVSCVYNLMVQDNLKTLIYKVDTMLQWGTPYDLECYNMWSSYFAKANKALKPKKYNMTTILPMAGRGSRFSMTGFVDPKPLIKVNNNPMVIEAVNCLPQATNTIFIGLHEHFDKYDIGDVIKQNIENSSITLIHDTTDGQATTCNIVVKDMDDEQAITISACDNGVYYDVDKYDELMNDTNVDVIVWSFDNHPTSKLYPQMYAWLDVDDNNNINDVSVKKQFENKQNRYCIIGTMFFRKSKYFKDGYKHIVENNIKTNGEYYVDNLLKYLIDMKYNVKVFNVDYYLCWGTPNDYKTFMYWQNFFKLCWWHPYGKEQTKYIAHRVNTIDELVNIPYWCGVELDLRDTDDKIGVVHDPYIKTDCTFDKYIEHVDNRFMILNIKSEGIEHEIIKILNKYNKKDYFFLDCSFPMIHKLSQLGEHNIAIRLSEYEDIQTVINMKNKVKWVWVDCFNDLILNKQNYAILKQHNFNICLVSPELQGKTDVQYIKNYKSYLKDNNIIVDMICTKKYNINVWSN